MPQITPHFWFDTEAVEAAKLYTSLLDDSEITDVTTIRETPTPTGDCDIVSFTLAGQPFQAISAGPEFKINPSISLLVNCSTHDEVDGLWNRLIPDGQALMPLDTYPFSQRYGWLQDRFGLTWQLMFTEADITQKIVPMLLFVGDVCGKAEEAITFYTSVFGGSVGDLARYGPGAEPDDENNVLFGAFTLDGYDFAAMDSAHDHHFAFNEAVSFIVPCETQAEIDAYWAKLSAVPESEQCGWLKDRFGVSWQIVPRVLDEMLQKADEDTRARVTQSFLQMKKLEVAELEQAYAGR